MGFNCDGKCTGPELIKPAGSGAPVSGLQNHSASCMGSSPPDNSRDVGEERLGRWRGHSTGRRPWYGFLLLPWRADDGLNVMKLNEMGSRTEKHNLVFERH